MGWRTRDCILAAVGAGLSVFCFWNLTGLEPAAWVLWVAAAPVLLLVQRMGWGGSFLLGLGVYALGELSLWEYLSILPVGVRLVLMLIPALAFGGAALVFRLCLKRGWGGMAIFAFPSVWGAYEYVASVLSPHGTFGHLAYTQMDFLAVAQLARLGGVWAVDFLPLLVSAGVAVGAGRALRWNEAGGRGTFLGIVFAAGLVVCGLGWGMLRLASGGDGEVLEVALVASDLPENDGLMKPELSGEIFGRYLAVVPEAKARGAEVLVMPEHLLAVSRGSGFVGVEWAEFEWAMVGAARKNGIGILVGIDLFHESGASNQACFFGSDGVVERYDKRHLLPGLESRFSAGSEEALIDAGRGLLGLAICKDLDFPQVGRGYSRKGAGALLVPAYDFVDDGWLHSRMALMRGIEGGFSVARAARSGRLTVSDSWGRVLEESKSGEGAMSLLVGSMPLGDGGTFYGRFGDWFAWLELLVVMGVLARCGSRAFAERSD